MNNNTVFIGSLTTIIIIILIILLIIWLLKEPIDSLIELIEDQKSYYRYGSQFFRMNLIPVLKI